MKLSHRERVAYALGLCNGTLIGFGVVALLTQLWMAATIFLGFGLPLMCLWFVMP